MSWILFDLWAWVSHLLSHPVDLGFLYFVGVPGSMVPPVDADVGQNQLLEPVL